MRRLLALAFVVFVSYPAITLPAAAQAESAARLPTRRVVLYKNGVGYFEHRGRITGNQQVPIDFTTAQLDDVLKSLTVVDLGEGRVTSVRFNSVAPLSERIRGLRLPFSEGTTRLELLNALRGARVEVRSGTTSASGRLVTVEQRRIPGPRPEMPVEVLEIGLLTEGGALRTVDVGSATTVQVIDAELKDDLRRYHGALGAAQRADLRRLVISTEGRGERELMVSYISEVPVWKSTYRILLPENPKGRTLLQGWAIVDNTVGEDWNDVELSLVAGAPQSFVQPISQPYYIRRPEIELPETAQLRPQAHEATMKTLTAATQGQAMATTMLAGLVKDPSGAAIAGATVTLRHEASGLSQTTRTGADGRYRFSSVPAGPASLFVDAPGFRRQVHSNFFLGVGRMNEIDTTLSIGSVAETVEVRASAMAVHTAAAMVMADVDAEGTDTGTLFRYDLKQRITIGKDQSALVPIVQAAIEAEPVTIWNRSTPVPLHALWVTNTSGQTLDGGTFNVIEGGAFAGEGVLTALRPEEKRLISYAADTAVTIRANGATDYDDDGDDEDAGEETVTRVRIANGMLFLSRERRSETTYEIRNNDTKARQVVIEHPFGRGWKLAAGLEPEETSASTYRLRVPVEAGATAELNVRLFKPDVQEMALTTIDSNLVALLVRQRRLDSASEAAMRGVLTRQAEIAELNAQLALRRRQVQEINADQARLRENMKALKGSSEEKALLRRYTGELNAQEDSLMRLRREITELQAQVSEANGRLATFVREVSFEGV